MKELEKLIKKSKLKKYEVAELLEISPNYLSMILKKKRKPSGKLAGKMATLFGVTIDDLNFFNY
jgi:transcriptional regulator with XRE-family HTH domain